MLETDDYRKKNDYEVIIIGGGPAGLAAAIWCADLNLRAAMFDDGAQPGGQLGWTFNEITNYPGIASVTADELRTRFIGQARGGGAELIAARVVSADLKSKSISLEDGRRFSADALIIATGVRRRRLNLLGETELLGKGILRSGVASRREVSGKHVVIAGGGDAALENAVILSETASRITVVHRSENLRARSEFVAAARESKNITFKLSNRLTAIHGRDSLEGVDVTDQKGATMRIDADSLLIRIGTQPNTEMFESDVDLDGQGYVKVNSDMSVGMKGVFAIGDAAFPLSPTLSTAVGTAAIATKAIEILRRNRRFS